MSSLVPADMPMPWPNFRKLIVLGDGAVGKTTMLLTYTTNAFPSEYAPYVYDWHRVAIEIEEGTYTVGLWDTGGGEDYDRLRPLSYPQTDVFLICFKVTWRASFENIRSKWAPEVRHHCPDVPFLIVATQIDLRGDSKLVKPKQRVITSEEGGRLARELGAAKYVECSALTQQGLKAVSDEAVIATLGKWPAEQSKRGVKCVVM